MYREDEADGTDGCDPRVGEYGYRTKASYSGSQDDHRFRWALCTIFARENKVALMVEDGRGLECVLDYHAPYVIDSDAWPCEQRSPHNEDNIAQFELVYAWR